MKPLKLALIFVLIVSALATVLTSETLMVAEVAAEQVTIPARPAS